MTQNRHRCLSLPVTFHFKRVDIVIISIDDLFATGTIKDPIKEFTPINRRRELKAHADVQCLSVNNVVEPLSALIVRDTQAVDDPSNQVIALDCKRTDAVVIMDGLQIPLQTSSNVTPV
jgi:hypothetical protein